MKHSIPLGVLLAWFTVAFVACQLIVAGQATTVYVSLSGNDANPCSIKQPCKTLRKGVRLLAPGRTLLIQAGTYAEGLYNVPSGTASAPVTIQAAPGAIVVLRPVGQDGVQFTPAAYVVVKDLTLDGSGNGPTADVQGIYLSSGAHHNTFQRVRVTKWPNLGVVFSRNNGNSPFNAVLDSWITGNGSGPGPLNGHGLYISTSDNRFENNEVDHNLGYGFHLYDDDGPKYTSRNILRNNRIHHNGRPTTTTFGIVVAWGQDNLVADNILDSNRGGIQVYASGSRVVISGNTVSNNTDYGIELGYTTDAPTLRNNRVYGNGTGIRQNGPGPAVPVLSGNLLTPPVVPPVVR